ncbi:PREDICTED: E3 ubiquitin-protein ligase RNF8-like [Camelina sativa]|uniref:RING-type E3 ubiquitin transferase BRCA1 n=1 Tax=Camelina sativa TaxID=90675 RepID=A0ABM0SRY0_CAMSA|nr:PREDICTED: E3 ubiquitin-protein ligase RNF8-like [Camelina sativa]XP_010415274.1 PREDICTED: E3 ubiquitin-protein ligase RNF8-like [Camelina sativa]
MENVVATVSGYHGSERFKLIKLISHSGASYVGAMSRSITHLVCWRFEGKKYDLAKKFNTVVVNHQWVEECVREGRRVSETPYMFESGEEVGPLMMELPAISGEAKATKKVNKATETFDKYFNNGEESRRGSTSELATWMDSVLLKEKNTEANRQSVRLRTKRPSNIFEDKENTGVAESSGKGKRRLVQKRLCRNLIDLESDEESDNSWLDNSDENRNKTQDTREPDDENVRECVFEPGETSALRHPGDSATQNWDVDEIEESENWSHSAVFKRPRSNSTERKLQEDGSNYNKTYSRREETEATEKVLPAQVSCIICWTEFSSSRGILPCGHRFCFSCIQKWADRLVSERKKTTCPLCKSNFITITKIEDAGSSDQNIYSQTVPDLSSTNNTLVVLPEEEERRGFSSLARASGCSKCFLTEPEELLIRCHLCNFRRIHSYCLDPYLLPWTCKHCNDLQMMYQRRNY